VTKTTALKKVKKAGHSFKYLISPCEPQENSKKENEKSVDALLAF
jgi:hypothetical protein